MDFKNFAYGSVLTAPSPATSGTSLVLQSGEGALFPTTYPYNIVVFASGENPDSSNAEIVTVTNKSSDTLTIVRAREGTTARAIVTGDQVMLAITSEMLRRFEGHFSITQSTRSLSSSNTAQDVFDSGQNSMDVEGDTLYEIEGLYDIRTGATSHSTGIGFAGTATINFLKIQVRAYKGGVDATVTATNGSTKSTLTNATQTPANTTTNTGVWFTGLISINAAGTLIPQITFSAAPGGTNQMAVGSYVKLRKLGKGNITIIGDWN